MNARPILIAAPLLLLAAACGDDRDRAPAGEQGGEAAGELLGGTISDDMIALEQLQSQSPPAERIVSDSAEVEEGEGEGEIDGAETAEADAAPAAPAPPVAPATPAQ